MTPTTKATCEPCAVNEHTDCPEDPMACACAEIGHGWENETTTHEPAARPVFPVDEFNGSCPSCGATDSIQSNCLTTHVWEDAQVNGGVLSFSGGYECMDDSVDSHIACNVCWATWAEPETIEYR